MNFKKTTIATVVGVSLSSLALSVSSNELLNAPNYKSFDSAQLQLKYNKIENVATVSGMRNQFDAQLGKTTFQWAGKEQPKPNLSALKLDQQITYAADFYLTKLTGLSSAKASQADAILANVHDMGRGAIIAKYKQSVAGIEVFNREYNILMDRELNLVASSGYLASSNSTKSISAVIKNVDNAFGDASSSISSAFKAMGGNTSSITLTTSSTKGQYEHFAVTNNANDKVLLGEPRAKKVFFEHKNQLVAAHYVEIETGSVDTRESEYYGYVVSADSGKILFKQNLTSHSSEFDYRIYADADGKPWDSPHGNVMPAPEGSDVAAFLTAPYLEAPLVSLSHGPISTMDPWLASDASTTTGNNVNAYVDAIAPQGFSNGDYHAEITSTNTFDYVYDVNEPEYSINNRKAAIVNLFFMNNYLHDDYYDHGFDEAAGNAQLVNYDRGGVEGDPLNVEVQDNSGFNNANMSTPADGASPRMQMYLWETTQAENGVDFGLTVSSHEAIGLLETVQFASFGADIYAVTGDLVRIEDGVDPIRDGCEASVNGADISGNIAVIDRGACNFTVKVKNAQDQGAIAVIIVNNVDDGTPAPMGGADDTVTIPSMGINYSDGAAIYALLDANETVSVDMFKNDLTRNFKDSSWDNAIVAHEWGHYISNRLVGNGSGLSSNQARSMGEGFGDFHALLLGSDSSDNLVAGNEDYAGAYGDTTYVASFVNGIRRFPYSTNMDINPSTFSYVEGNPQVHASGSVYGVMLWDSFIGLVNDERHTFDEAKNLMKDYLVASYKMMPMAPTFTEGRDALLAAAYANDVEDYKIILAAFARRGMGLGAVSPSRYSSDHAGVVESFETELSAFSVTSHGIDANYEGLMSGFCSKDNIIDKGETATVSFTIQNNGSEMLSGLTGKVVVESDHDVTFANDGLVSFDDLALFTPVTSSPVEFTLNEAGTGDELVLKFVSDEMEGVEIKEYMLSTTVNVDFQDRELTGTTQYEDLNTLSRLKDFTENVISGGERANGTFGLDQWDEFDGLISATSNGFASDVAYETRPMTVGFAGDYSISFWHLYNIESGYDGAVVEVSINGDDWVDVTEAGAVFEGSGYNEVGLEFTDAAIAERSMFSGFNYGWETINFGETLNGNQVQFRFRIASDFTYTPEPQFGFTAGWYIDDITFNNIQTSIFSDVVAGDTFACENRLPTVTVMSSATAVNEGEAVSFSATAIDANATDTLTYMWEQTSGTAATLTGADTAELSFTAPLIASGTETLEFTLTVNDGVADVVTPVSVDVSDIPEVVEPKTKSSSGGSMSWLGLLLLPLAILRRLK